MIDCVKMSSFLVLLLSIAALGCTPPLTAAQQSQVYQKRGKVPNNTNRWYNILFSFDGTLQCGQTRCPNPLPSMGWISNIAAPQRSASFARLSWGPDPSLMEGQRYGVVWREFNTQDNFTVTSGPEVRKIEIFYKFMVHCTFVITSQLLVFNYYFA